MTAAALVDDDPDVGAVEGAEMMLESGTKVVMESVPVGFIVFVGGADVVGRVVTGSEVVKLPANAGGVGVSVGVVVGVMLGVVVIGGGVEIVPLLLLPGSSGVAVGVFVGVVVIGGSVGVSVGVVVGVVVMGGSVGVSVGVVVGVVVMGGSVGVFVGVVVGVVVIWLLSSGSDDVSWSGVDRVCEAVLLAVSGGGVIVGLTVVSSERVGVMIGSSKSEPVGRLKISDEVVKASSALLTSAAIDEAAD